MEGKRFNVWFLLGIAVMTFWLGGTLILILYTSDNVYDWAALVRNALMVIPPFVLGYLAAWN